MLRSAAVAEMQKILGFRTDRENECISALQTAQRLLERGRSLPYFLKQESQTLTVASGSGETDLPERFLREVQDEGPTFVNSDGDLIEIEKVTYDIAKSRFVSEDAGAPVAYALRKETLWFRPDRDTSYSLSWGYYKGAVILDSEVENEWLEEELGAPEVLWARAGMHLAKIMRNATAYDLFKEVYVEAWVGMQGDTIEREAENLPLFLGERL